MKLTVAVSKSQCCKDDALIIAGGVYVETCLTPQNVSLMGSGGRATMPLLGLRRDVELLTFHPPALRDDVILNFAPLGASVTTYATPFRHTFEYIHPLSRPMIYPLPTTKRIVAVEGEEILRFGCLEGDFKIGARQAVYDRQSGAAPVDFSENGSTAERLAVVLNVDELRRSAGQDDIAAAARSIMKREKAAAIVVKDGPAGAYVFAAGEPPVHVPAYMTRSVYKIGSGDVFSAVFAHSWFLGPSSAADAAHAASRRTADYVATPVFPLSESACDRTPVAADLRPRKVFLAADVRGIADRWLVAEASRTLKALGMSVISTNPSRPFEKSENGCDVIMLIVQGDQRGLDYVRAAVALGKPTVVLLDCFSKDALTAIRALGAPAWADLCTAAYQARWIQA